jgi:hypothetical protein
MVTIGTFAAARSHIGTHGLLRSSAARNARNCCTNGSSSVVQVRVVARLFVRERYSERFTPT